MKEPLRCLLRDLSYISRRLHAYFFFLHVFFSVLINECLCVCKPLKKRALRKVRISTFWGLRFRQPPISFSPVKPLMERVKHWHLHSDNWIIESCIKQSIKTNKMCSYSVWGQWFYFIFFLHQMKKCYYRGKKTFNTLFKEKNVYVCKVHPLSHFYTSLRNKNNLFIKESLS